MDPNRILGVRLIWSVAVLVGSQKFGVIAAKALVVLVTDCPVLLVFRALPNAIRSAPEKITVKRS